jgi:hypothetical protein
MEADMGVLLRGGCPCDAVRFEITAVFDAGYCHCNRCRKQSGAPVFAFVHVPRAVFTLLSGELVSEPWERLGQGMICATCRADEPARVRPTFHQCVSSKLPWLEINDGLPRFSENTITHPKERQSPIVADPAPIE